MDSNIRKISPLKCNLLCEKGLLDLFQDHQFSGLFGFAPLASHFRHRKLPEDRPNWEALLRHVFKRQGIKKFLIGMWNKDGVSKKMRKWRGKSGEHFQMQPRLHQVLPIAIYKNDKRAMFIGENSCPNLFKGLKIYWFDQTRSSNCFKAGILQTKARITREQSKSFHLFSQSSSMP